METSIEKQRPSGKKSAPTAVVVKPPAKELKDAEKRLNLAREYYRQMQRNWFLFAKEIKIIRDKHDHGLFGADSFQKLCEKEFPLTSYSTISKFIQIIEKMGDQIEKRLEDDKYRLPSYEACYQLTSVETRMSTEDFSKLRKQVLDERLSFHGLRARLKELVATANKELKKKIEHETDAYMEQTQRELSRSLKDEDDDHHGLLDDDEFIDEDEDHEIDVTDSDDVDSTVALSARVDYLIENLPEFVEQVEKIDSSTKTFIKKLKKLAGIVEETIETLEEQK